MMKIPTLYALHKWLGLGLGAWLILATLTGAIWTVRNAVETSDEEAVLTSACTAGTASTRWRAALLIDGEQITRIDARDDDFRLLRVVTTDRDGAKRIHQVNQCTGASVRLSDRWEQFMAAVTWLHGTLLAGAIGKLALGLLGLLTMLSVILGVWLWWLRSGRSLRKGLTIASSRQPIVGLRSWHRVLGAATAALLIVSIASGTVLAYSPWLITSPTARSYCAGHESIRGLEPHLNFILGIANQRVPDGSIRSVRLDSGNCVARIYLQSPSVALESLTDRIWIALPARQVIAHNRGESAGIGDRSRAWALALHSGAVFGTLGWLMTLSSGIVLLALTVTGAWVYFWTKRLTRKLAKGPATASSKHGAPAR